MTFPKFSTTDKTIRAVLIQQLGMEYKDHSKTAIIPEFTLPNGLARIDIAVVNGIMHGYELKSDLDNLFRLKSQMDAYNLIFDKVTLVVGKKHVIEALDLIPQWWGITIAKSLGNAKEPLLIEIRKAEDNPEQDMYTIANLLWKIEALEILSKINESKNLKSKQKRIICKKLAECLGEQELKDYVREQLIKRSINANFRSVEELKRYDD
ncbi:MAG TPA: sce7726 family protein [Candidatus Saccharimonadales bacterium]|nr:sce7726 family protein [Candidatus Saccharimonadales bacterium]